MSTATIDSLRSSAAAHSRTMTLRLAWKEFRMFRGMWLAVLVMGAIVQWSIDVLSPPSADHPTLSFVTALAAAVLYAVAAAATVFSVEHEEQTYGFLACLPAKWWPVFAGKLSILMASSVALACGLSLVGWMIAGYQMPGGDNTAIALGMFGVAIFEAVAWGTLFSLLVNRPLLAAILTLVVGVAAVNLAVFLASAYAQANLRADAYGQAAPLRLAIVAAVLALSTFVARRWLNPSSEGATVAHALARLRSFGRREKREASVSRFVRQHARRRMLARLIWQSWRDAGWLLLSPPGVAALLACGCAAAIVLVKPAEPYEAAAWISMALFVPVLYGAMAFSADQRRREYRFLSEHAAQPRYVWLARHVVWLGALVVLSVAVWLVVMVLAALGVRFVTQRFLEEFLASGQSSDIGGELAGITGGIFHGAGLVWCGVLAAYGLGQFCSMLIKSEILAAFVALVLSVLISAWAAVLFAWQLSGWLFLLPLAAAFLLATWLRAPDWIAGRNSWPSWLKVATPVIAVPMFLGVLVPVVRLAQIAPSASGKMFFRPPSTGVEALLAAHRAGDTPEARETAAMYVRAMELLRSAEDNKLADSKAAAVKLAIEASTRPTCRFDFNLDQYAAAPIQGGRQARLDDNPTYLWLNILLFQLFQFEPRAPLDQQLAALRMSNHLASGQPSVVFIDQLDKENSILAQIGDWAGQAGRTDGELKSALDELKTHLRTPPPLLTALIADHQLVEDVVLGKTPPVVLEQLPESPLVHLAWLANQLPWEQERALLALDSVTRQNLAEAEGLMSMSYLSYFDGSIRRWIRPRYAPDWNTSWILAQPAAATSYLFRQEYEARAPVHTLYRAFLENRTHRSATLLRMALILYRREHGAYPDRLDELAPQYLDEVPVDPYTGQSFEYEPHGLHLPLLGSSTFTDIYAGTPLFWSVGGGYARLQQRLERSDQPNEIDPDGPPREVIETVYVLQSPEPSRWGEPAFAYPLPR